MEVQIKILHVKFENCRIKNKPVRKFEIENCEARQKWKNARTDWITITFDLHQHFDEKEVKTLKWNYHYGCTSHPSELQISSIRFFT